MVETTTEEFELTESHKQRLQELEEALDVDVHRQLSQLLMQSIDDTYREASSGSPSEETLTKQ